MNKFAGYTFAIASILMLIVMMIYIEDIHSTEQAWDVRIENLKANWFIAATIWRAEFISAIALAWASLHFGKKHSAWYFIAIAHIIMVGLYAVMLGGYPEVKSQEGYNILYYIGHWIFAVSNFLWVFGMALVIQQFSGWFKYIGGSVSLILSLAFLAIFFELLTFEDLAYVMPLIMIMYILNAFVGIKYAKAES